MAPHRHAIDVPRPDGKRSAVQPKTPLARKWFSFRMDGTGFN